MIIFSCKKEALFLKIESYGFASGERLVILGIEHVMATLRSPGQKVKLLLSYM